MRLDQIMKQKNLIKVDGKLQGKTQYKSAVERMLESADIPDYDKIAERPNPLEPVVAKFADNGYEPISQAFIAFDEDEDGVLTLEEI